MADSSIATKDVEDWIRGKTLPTIYHQKFTKRKLPLLYSGEFECDAVSNDGKIVCFISTSFRKTKSGKHGAGKFSKIRADAYWALSLKKKPNKILFIFTDKSMIELINQEKNNGRFPRHFKTLSINLPLSIKKKLTELKRKAAAEVSNRK